MVLELKIGFTDDLADMVYDVFREDPSLIKQGHILLDKDSQRLRLKHHHDWIVGVYDGGKPIGAFWGKGENVQAVAQRKYRGRWLTRGVLEKFANWFFSKYEYARAVAHNAYAYKLLLKYGFRGDPSNMIKVK